MLAYWQCTQNKGHTKMNAITKRAAASHVAGHGFTFAVVTLEGEPIPGPALDDLVKIIEAFGGEIVGAGSAQTGDHTDRGLYLIRLQAPNLDAMVAALNGWAAGTHQFTGWGADSIEWWGNIT
jgi:hypothetical protein